ncbi:LPXTG cell wall anchor domain-containing protein [Limosilactobacillus reuteri]|uniref:Cell wall anchor protein n=1 Tax=Limosilactobacillus reuteri TaxID=1598 RepID=A0ABD6XD97_LIMRT|nr:LPXTG cell wall anchor domain-containing protein [Limosilactobacillus reuteri]PEH07839.1 cell wall anchor protein [Lactobacillus sp. UMNPBX3]MQB69336.1 LPXTG cell wall anchor domain-containing protein [Limosilactobacillus reuteri]MQB71495.1 LPXTG cell wall anchor domain-containing protein [Limosilactobacillus reuteri]MQB75336.1 LPXTG cell wall anchor domain-containing protein [Limosilactobacillus reuteri]MQB84837.1 LPXTG cell wall anchor domain-containing protein [Limosilactobacillus reuter
MIAFFDLKNANCFSLRIYIKEYIKEERDNMNHLNHLRVLRNTCLVGLTTASTILSLSLNTPPVLATTQELITQPVSNANNQKECVQIKRVIYFHLLNEVKKVEQVSYAHREVPNDPTKKVIWIIEPFEEVNVPDQAGFRPSMDKIPTVTEIEDLSQLKSAVNVYYQPLNKDEGPKKDSKENTLAEKQKEGQAKENKKEEKQDSQDNYPMKEDLGDDNQVTENYEEVNNTRKQQNVHQRIAGINNRLNRSHRDSRKNDNSDQQILPQTGNETDNLTTFLGLGITVTVAGMSLFSLNRAHKKK